MNRFRFFFSFSTKLSLKNQSLWSKLSRYFTHNLTKQNGIIKVYHLNQKGTNAAQFVNDYVEKTSSNSDSQSWSPCIFHRSPFLLLESCLERGSGLNWMMSVHLAPVFYSLPCLSSDLRQVLPFTSPINCCYSVCVPSETRDKTKKPFVLLFLKRAWQVSAIYVTNQRNCQRLSWWLTVKMLKWEAQANKPPPKYFD